MNGVKKSPFQQATQTKDSIKKDMIKLQARVLQLRQAEQKNLELAKWYELATEKIQIGRSVKQKLNKLKSESDLILEQKMQLKRLQIQQIKQKQDTFIESRHMMSKSQYIFNISNHSSQFRQTFGKEYKSQLKESIIKAKESILSENQRLVKQIYVPEDQRKQRHEEFQTQLKKRNEENYQLKVQRELDLAMSVKKQVQELEREEQLLLSRLKITQNLATTSKRRYQNEASPIRKLEDIK